MKTRYYLATVNNATSPAVRCLAAVMYPYEALAIAAMELARQGFYVTGIQELNEEQYFAPNNAPHSSGVTVRPIPLEQAR